jgi:hypothetical protein
MNNVGTQQFEFTGKIKSVLFGGMALGAVALLVGAYLDNTPGHAQTWTNLLHNLVFLVGVCFISQFMYSASTTAYGGWFVGFKRVWEAMFGNLLIIGGLFLLIIVGGLLGGFHHLYAWAEPEALNDKLIQGKAGLLNKTVFSAASAGILLLWWFWGTKIRENSVAEDTEGGLQRYTNLKWWTASFLPIGGFSSAFAIWFWLMSIDPHWFSTMFAWYSTASFLVTAMAMTVLTIIFLKKIGYMQHITDDHMHDLGKYMFGFSVFWTYLWFSQFMLIWYCNNGEETVYFKTRMTEYWPMFVLNLLMNFVAPFLILVRNTAKRRTGIMVFTAILLILGHWLDFFQMIKPGVWNAINEHSGAVSEHATKAVEHAAGGEHEEAGIPLGFFFPGLTELFTFVGFLSFFAYLMFNNLTKASLVPQNDPYLEESLHHQVM